jgi:GNAT superfamily N-acetyltransferase
MSATIQILRASDCSFDELATAFNRGFEGYAIPPAMTAQAMEERVSEQDILLDSSLVLSGEDGPAGVGLMGVRGARAWCGELAVAPAYRGGGWGRLLIERLIHVARARSLKEMWLEVLTENTPAFQLYQSLGFRIERELTTYSGPLGHQVARRAFTGPLMLQGLGDAGEESEESAPERAPVAVEASRVLADYDALQLVRPSWEYERVVLDRLAAEGRLRALAISGEEEGQGPDAYLLVEVRENGAVRLMNFGARPGADAAGGLELATTLVSALTQQYAGATFSAAEVPPGDPRGPVLEAASCPVVYRYFEMALAL